MFWIGTSWKMNKTLAEALAFADALRAQLPALDARIQPFVVPPFTAVRQVKQALAGTRALVGAQNMHWEDAGAWTGEVSPPMLVDCGLDLVELGHSERRTHFGETDATVGRKTAAAMRHGLLPLVCIGETLEQRRAGRTRDVLSAQVLAALQGLSAGQHGRPLLFAYEPVWAIGEHGSPADPGDADAQQAFVKTVAGDVLGAAPPVLYGGSVSAGNAAALARCRHVDGLFIGRAAWSAQGFVQMLQIAQSQLPLDAPSTLKEKGTA